MDSFTRVKCNYQDFSLPYLVSKKDFKKQYCHLYSTRLAQLRDRLQQKALLKWEGVEVKQLADLQTDSETVRCVLIGTLFKYQELRPSILKEISDELQIVPQQKLLRFVDDSDTVVLEDEEQRIRLVGDIDVHSVVTGVVVALCGEAKEDYFHVDNVLYPGPESPAGLEFKPSDEDQYLVILSGLDMAHCHSNSLGSLQLFTELVTGWLGGTSVHAKMSRVALVLIAGNIFSCSSETKDGKVINTSLATGSSIMETVKEVDAFLAELAESVRVEIMPGEFDPSNYQLPQQPINHAMFPKASEFSNMHPAPNPHMFQINNRLVTGSSGQAIDSIGKYCNLQNPVQALEATLYWGNISPTSPDALASYPFRDVDPFILNKQPHVYFTANHESFSTKFITYDYGNGITQDTRLVAVPSFHTTGSCVLVNLTDLTAEEVSFQANIR